jgi:hypothetical protein
MIVGHFTKGKERKMGKCKFAIIASMSAFLLLIFMVGMWVGLKMADYEAKQQALTEYEPPLITFLNSYKEGSPNMYWAHYELTWEQYGLIKVEHEVTEDITTFYIEYPTIK